MRKLMLLAAMLAFALAAVPAVAQVTLEFGQEAESGDVALSNEVSSSGDNSNVCAPALQFANTGNLQNAQGFTQGGAQYSQYGGSDDGGSETGDVSFEGASFTFEPSLEAECAQTVEQSASASY